MPLPTKKRAPQLNIADQTIFVYGRPKIGKSTWCSQADGALFLATEPGLKSLEVAEVEINGWATPMDQTADGRIRSGFLAACKEIAAGKHSYRTVVIDTIDNLYKMCVDHVCTTHEVEHQSDFKGFGKGYDLINSLFHKTLTALCRLPYGVIMTSHAQEREEETSTGKVSKWGPTIPQGARKVILGMADMILFYDIGRRTGPDGKQVPCRVLRTKPAEKYDAGDRTRRLPAVIDLGDDPEGAYGRFLEAYVKGGGEAGGGPSVSPEQESDAADAPGDASPVPTDSTVPPPPADEQTAAPVDHLARLRALLAAAGPGTDLKPLADDAKKCLSKTELEQFQPEYVERRRRLAVQAGQAGAAP